MTSCPHGNFGPTIPNGKNTCLHLNLSFTPLISNFRFHSEGIVIFMLLFWFPKCQDKCGDSDGFSGSGEEMMTKGVKCLEKQKSFSRVSADVGKRGF